MNMEREFMKIGEQHTEGASMCPTTKIQRDTLNFGWFSLPSAKKDRDSCEERLNSPLAGGELQEGCTSHENGNRATPKEGQRPDSQPRSPSMAEPANRCEVEQPEYEQQQQQQQQQQGYSQKSQNHPPVSPAHNENVALDWPVSALAGQLMTRQHTTAEPSVQPRTPVARSEPKVPRVPVPPLHWQGYQNCSRPTYATWQSQHHGNRNQQAENTFNHVWNTNNNNTGKEDNKKSGVSKNSWKKANKIWDKSSNNDNGIEQQSRARNQRPSNKSLMSVSNYSIDGNNNNWLRGDTEGGASPTSVRTLPPYEYSTESSPTFYNPSVVMNWEDTEQQSNSTQDKQGFKHASLMKRIRSSLLHMWSLVPCLKNQDEDTTPRSRLFKYDRFDNEKSHG